MLTSRHASADTLTIYAAASLTESLTTVAKRWQHEHPSRSVIRFSFAASSTLAKQIEAGAPADIFISADNAWMSYLADRQKIDRATQFSLLSNHLVLIAPAESKAKASASLKPGDVFPVAMGRVCIADPQSVPAGRYAAEALRYLGWWDTLQDRLVTSADVRTTLLLVNRAECRAGIVYQTDAQTLATVRILAKLPDNSHTAIVYPVAKTNMSKNPDVGSFLSFLRTKTATGIFKRYGFDIITH